MPKWSIDVGAAVVGHGEKHHAVAVNLSRLDEGLLVGFPDAVDDGRLSRISGGAMIEFAAEVDHSHGVSLPRLRSGRGAPSCSALFNVNHQRPQPPAPPCPSCP